MTGEDIRTIAFDKAMRGYRPEEVDVYLEKVAVEMEKLQTESEKLQTEKEDSDKKLFILAEKVDQYRNDEETLKTALLNAQRMGESVIHEARQKAETILYDANSKASQQKEEAAENVLEMENELTRLKAEVAKFKCDVLELYRQHIESLSAVPGDDQRAARRAAKKNKRSVAEQEVIEETPAVSEPLLAEAPTAVLNQSTSGKAKMKATPFDIDLPELEEETQQDDSFNAYQGIKFED